MVVNTLSERDAFNVYIDETLGGLHGKTLEEALTEFRAYQRELDDAQSKLKVAEEQSLRGESRELDDEAFWKRVNKRLDNNGIPE